MSSGPNWRRIEGEQLAPHNQLLRIDGARQLRKSFHLEEGKPDFKRSLPCGNAHGKNRQFAVNTNNIPVTPAAKPAPNTILCVPLDLFGTAERRGHIVLAAHCLHIPMPTPAPWRDHSSLTIKNKINFAPKGCSRDKQMLSTEKNNA